MPRQPVLVLFLALLCFTTDAQVNRCTGADGRVVYSDTLCPSSAKDSKTIVKPPEKAPARLSTGLAPPTRVEFTGAAAMDYIKASALLDNIRTMGRDCEWALKVDERKLQDCVAFIGRLQPGGEFEQIGARLAELNTLPDNMKLAGAELPRILLHTQEIVRYKEFMFARLGLRK